MLVLPPSIISFELLICQSLGGCPHPAEVDHYVEIKVKADHSMDTSYPTYSELGTCHVNNSDA
jgi:hypothetical protein